MAEKVSREKATFGGGCFWCIEAVFTNITGVESVIPGYSGGSTENPSYEEVCSGTTGHAEVVQIEYDPSIVSYSELLEVFFAVHNPTTKNRQGPDVGSQYRSVVFYHSPAQKEKVEEFLKKLEKTGEYSDPIVTEVEPLEAFYEAEEYHHDYYEKNPNAPYCAVNIKPKIEKLSVKFEDKVNPTP